MRIKSVTLSKIKIPLLKPYKSSLRKIEAIEDIVVTIKTDNGFLGYGSATETIAITGDSHESIISVISNILAPKIIGKDMIEFDNLLNLVHNALERNTSAKAAIDVALHDLLAKHCNLPLYQFLGGGVREIVTGMTVGIKTTQDMIDESQALVSQGFVSLKIKAGINPQDDIVRIKAIRQAVGDNIQLCIDANQGWNVKEALSVMRMCEKLNLDVAIVEQPTKANDLAGLKFIRENVECFVFADEACFSPRDTLKIISDNVADGIVIKLMKSGGFYTANTIYGLANSYNIPCMAGCMLESPIGITAMASFAAGKKNINFIDLGTITRLKYNSIIGGAKLDGSKLILADKPGLGIDSLGETEFLCSIE